MDNTQVVLDYNMKNKIKSKYLLGFAIGILILLLFARDVMGVGINKYLFLLITAIVTFALPLNQVVCFIAFVMPLYVGLPGNYMTLIFLVRFFLDYKKLRVKASTCILCVLVGAYALCHGIITNHTSISELMFFPGLLLVVFLFSLKIKISKLDIIVSYATGVAALGLIMLFATLRIYDFSELLSTAFRLGDDASSYVENGIMNVSIDPNFYGYFSMVSIMLVFSILNEKNFKECRLAKILLVIEVICSIIVSLIGLSRTFIVVAILWFFIYVLIKKNFRVSISMLFVAVITVCAIFSFLPNVMNVIGERFTSSDVVSGNGRLDMVSTYFDLWYENVITILFGIGVFDCEVHCTQLQVLYGGGIIFVLIYLSFFISLVAQKSWKKDKGSYLPFIIALIMSATLPAFRLINYMFPLYLSFLFITAETEKYYIGGF